jgi:hypothetical protein
MSWPSSPDSLGITLADPAPIPGLGVRPRQCGRCRSYFDGDPSLPPQTQSEWWLCDPCRQVLLGHGPRQRSALEGQVR